MRLTFILTVVFCAIAGVGAAQQSKSPATLKRKLFDGDPGESILAAWERVATAARHKVVNGPARSRYGMPQKQLQRFVGFVEGKLGVSIPKSFLENLENAEIFWNGDIYFPTQAFSPWRIFDQQKTNILPSSMPSLKMAMGENLIKIFVATGNFPSAGEDGTMVLPAKLSEQLSKGGKGKMLPISSALFTKDRMFVAVVGDDEPGGTLWCLSRSTRKVIWSKEFVAYAGESYRGTTEWFTEIRINAETIVLFHCSDTAFGIEGFNLEGEQQFYIAPLLSQPD